MKQQRKFENKKILSIGNIGQKSIYFGLIMSTVLIMLIGKADLAIVNRISIFLTDLSSPVIATISKQTQIIGDSFIFLKNTASFEEIESLISFIIDSTIARVVNFSTPVFAAILLTSSAFVISLLYYFNFLINFEPQIY